MTRPTPEVCPETAKELVAWMVANHAGSKRVVRPLGGGTSPVWSSPPVEGACLLGTSRFRRVLEYPARDMTITVEAGMTIDELQQVLATEGQRLPLDVPHREHATLGGVLATNTSGSRRYGLGTIRDSLIGVSACDAQGRLFKSGGRVVKNVAGYDLCKMLIGSEGSLAIVTQATLKVLPLPQSAGAVWVPLVSLEDCELLLASLVTTQTRPVAVEAWNRAAVDECLAVTRHGMAGPAGLVCVAFEGSEREVHWQTTTLAEEFRRLGATLEIQPTMEAPETLWADLNRFQNHTSPPQWKFAVRPSRIVEVLVAATRLGFSLSTHAGSGVGWGRVNDSLSAVELPVRVAELRRIVETLHGHLRWLGGPTVSGEPPPGSPVPPGTELLLHKLKRQLDPEGILYIRSPAISSQTP
jgi:glycolate oxidase FAD binding subunit